jgi:Rieske Fe-S protein
VQMNKDFTRRSFLKTLTLAGTAAAFMPLIASVRVAEAAGVDFVAAGKVEDFTEGEFKKVALPDGLNVYITKKGKDFVAYSAKCTHRGCDVLWVPGANGFRCPCHGARFDSSGAVVQGPAQRNLPQLATKVDAGQVWVQG